MNMSMLLYLKKVHPEIRNNLHYKVVYYGKISPGFTEI